MLVYQHCIFLLVAYHFHRVILMKFKLIVALLLFCSFGANIFLGSKVLHYYTLFNELRLDPLELHFYSKKEFISTKVRVVMLGDSRVLAWPVIESESFDVYNRGIHGQTSIQIRDRFAVHIPDLQPDIVVLQLGINDLKTIGIFPQRKEKILEDCKLNIQLLIEKIRRLDAQVILTTTIPAGPIPLVRRPVWSDDIDIEVQKLNLYIKSIQQEGVHVLDIASLINDTQYLDALHIEKEAYKTLNYHLEKVILHVIESNN